MGGRNRLSSADDATREPARGHRAGAARLVDYLRPVLAAQGEEATVRELVARTRALGTAADRQRAAYRRRGLLQDVVDLLVAETARD